MQIEQISKTDRRCLAQGARDLAHGSKLGLVKLTGISVHTLTAKSILSGQEAKQEQQNGAGDLKQHDARISRRILAGQGGAA